jgi:hypothetical protein
VILRNDSLANENYSLQLKFEGKNVECEQIAMALHEDKIKSSTQQLRNTEVRLQENLLL